MAVGRLDTLGLLHDHIRVHHDETPVGIVDESRVACLLDHSRKGGRAETDVEDGVHHSRHGTSGAGTAAYEKRIGRIAEFLAHDCLCGFQSLGDLFLKVIRITSAEGIVLGAAFGSDSESGRYRHAELAHLGQVGSLPSQELTHLSVALGGLATETIDPFLFVEHIIKEFVL